MTRLDRLERLRNHSTKYEVVAETSSQYGKRYLIAYTSRRSRHGLLKACQSKGEAIIKAFGITDNDQFIPSPKAADGFRIGVWQFRFSGRTQREAIMQGELPWIGEKE